MGLVCVVSGCTDSHGQDRAASRVELPATYSELVSHDGAWQVTYRSTQPGSPGSVVWRLENGVNRLDEVDGEDAVPLSGTYAYLEPMSGDIAVYSCTWSLRSANDPHALVGCTNDVAGGLAVSVLLAALASFEERLDDRTFLGSASPCFRNTWGQELCVNRRGQVTYFDDGRFQYEVTELSDVVEAFNDPFETGPEPTPITLDDLLSVESLDLPAAFTPRG